MVGGRGALYYLPKKTRQLNFLITLDRHQEESSTRLSVTQIRCNSNGEKTAVKYQCCGSGMFITDPDFYPSWIPDPGSRISDPGSKNSNKEFSKNFWSFYPRNFHHALKYMSLGSGIRVPSSGPRRGFELTSSRVGVRHSDQMAS